MIMSHVTSRYPSTEVIVLDTNQRVKDDISIIVPASLGNLIPPCTTNHIGPKQLDFNPIQTDPYPDPYPQGDPEPDPHIHIDKRV